jgi:hypothetical protein
MKADEMSWVCRAMGKIRKAYSNLFGKYERKRLLGRPRCRRQGIIRIDQAQDWIVNFYESSGP